MRVRARRKEARGDSALIQLPGDDELNRLWAEVRSKEILRQAREALRAHSRFSSKTVSGFELHAFEGHSPQEVADRLGMSVQDVYNAKHRCLAWIRSTVSELEAAYEL